MITSTIGNVVLFVGGYAYSGGSYQYYNNVDIYNATSNTWNTATLSQARYYIATSSIGEIIAFGGGWDGSSLSSVVDVYNITSNSWFTLNLSQPRHQITSLSFENKILFAGGYGSNAVDIFDFDPALLPPLQSPLQPPLSVPTSSNTPTNVLSSNTSISTNTSTIQPLSEQNNSTGKLLISSNCSFELRILRT
jgi:hypothetical protein